MAGADNFPSAEGRITWAEHVAPKNHVKWGIRLTQGMPTSCGRADPIPADYTACRSHLSEADTHLGRFGLATPAHPPAPTAGSKCRRRFLAASLRIDSLNSLDANFRREADRRRTSRLAARQAGDAESSTYEAALKIEKRISSTRSGRLRQFLKIRQSCG